MTIEGRIHIRLDTVQGDAPRVTVRSSRPLAATSLLQGKTPAQALAIVPMLYNVCGHAQAHAAHLACAGVGARVARDADGPVWAREILVMIETAKEHLTRILIDWPQYLDEETQAAELKPIMSMPARVRRALFADGKAFGNDVRLQADFELLDRLLRQLDDCLTRVVYAHTATAWSAIADVTRFTSWVDRGASVAARLVRHVACSGWSGAGGSAIAFLPELSDRELQACFDPPAVDAFIAQPSWRGEAVETTALARAKDHPLIRALMRDHRNGLLPRLCARLVELAHIPARIKATLARIDTRDEGTCTSAMPDLSGVGIGQVDAARGRLVHCVELQRGVIRRYHVLAPTEWNFHPHGAVARGLAALRSANVQHLRQQAMLLIDAVDPCVACEVTVH